LAAFSEVTKKGIKLPLFNSIKRTLNNSKKETEYFKTISNNLQCQLERCVRDTESYYVSNYGKVLHANPRCNSLQGVYETVLVRKNLKYHPNFFCKKC